MLVSQFGSEIGNAGESPRLVAAAGRSIAWKARDSWLCVPASRRVCLFVTPMWAIPMLAKGGPTERWA